MQELPDDRALVTTDTPTVADTRKTLLSERVKPPSDSIQTFDL